MPDLQQASVVGKARLRLRNNAGLVASVLAHATLLVTVLLFGSPRLLATAAPQPIVVDIVRPEELPKSEATRSVATEQSKQPQSQQQQQAQSQPQQQQAQASEQQAAPQREQPQQAKSETQPQAQQPPSPPPGMQAQPSATGTTAPVFTSLYPWPQARPDVQAGDYRTFESIEKSDRHELAEFKARLKECWHPPAVGGRKLSAALRVALRIDGSLAGAPELVEVSASPDAVALVASAKQALSACGPFAFLPADSYASWKALSLTFSADDIAVAAVTQ